MPGDRIGAEHFVQKIERELDSRDALTDTEQRRLRRMLVRWRLRAQGMDIRYQTHGTKPGRAKVVGGRVTIERSHAKK